MQTKNLTNAILVSLVLLASCQSTQVNAPNLDHSLNPASNPKGEAITHNSMSPQTGDLFKGIQNYASTNQASGAFSEFDTKSDETCPFENTTFVGVLPSGCNVTIVVTENGNPILTLVNPPPGSYPVRHGCSCGDSHIRAVATLSGTCSGERVLSDYTLAGEPCSPTATPTPTPVPTPPPGSTICDPETIKEAEEILKEGEKLSKELVEQGLTTESFVSEVPTGDFSTQGTFGDYLDSVVDLQAKLVTWAAEIKLPKLREEKAAFEQSIAEDKQEIESLNLQIRGLVRSDAPDKFEQLKKLHGQISDLKKNIKISKEEIKVRDERIEENLKILELRDKVQGFLDDQASNPDACPPPPGQNEVPCPENIKEIMQENIDRAAKAHTDYHIGKDVAVTTVDMTDSNGDRHHMVSHSGEKSKEGYYDKKNRVQLPDTIKAPEEYDPARRRYFKEPTLNSSDKPYAFYDSERKALEHLAYRKNHDGVDITGTMLLYDDRPTCDHCQSLPAEFRLMFPGVNLIWYDKNGKCF